MTTTGIVRRIDELGRIVIPKEIRKNLRIKNGDNLEILVDGENITLKKYSQIENLENIASMYAESFYQVLKYNVIITDTDKIIAVGGNLKKKYINNIISEDVERMIERRDNFVERKKKNIEISPGISEFCYYTVATVINNGDSIGSVIILSMDTPMLEQEEKLGSILANILSNYFAWYLWFNTLSFDRVFLHIICKCRFNRDLFLNKDDMIMLWSDNTLINLLKNVDFKLLFWKWFDL